MATRGIEGRATAPVRLAHLGLGRFFRAHQAAYTDDAPDAAEWGYAAFTGRHPQAAAALAAQNGRYTLVIRGADGDRFRTMEILSETWPGSDQDAWWRVLAAPATALVTVTITEAGYHRNGDGGIDTREPAVAADIAALRRAHPASTAPGRLVSGLAARRRAGAGPLAVVPCDNLAGNGAAVGRVVRELAELVDPGLATWVDEAVSFVSTVVDRITPATTEADRAAVRDATGVDDRCPVVTEPFREWVLAGDFPAGRPSWHRAGAVFVDDPTPFERRKLWLLNGAHSLLAYAGPLAGHVSVAEAFADERCRGWVEAWWDEAARHLQLPASETLAYRDALAERFSNPRIAHRLAQIAADGSQKLPVRVVPVVRAERSTGRLPLGAARILAAWICHLRGLGAPIDDSGAGELLVRAGGDLRRAVPGILDALAPGMGEDADLVAAVTAIATDLSSGRRAS